RCRCTATAWAWIPSTSSRSRWRSRAATASSCARTTSATSRSSSRCAAWPPTSSRTAPPEGSEMPAWRLALLLAAGVAYALLSHWMMLFHPAAPWAVPVLLGPLWLTALGLAAARFGRAGAALVLVAGVLFFVAVLRSEAIGPERLYLFQHVGINALLCGWFGSTLRPGRLSLIGQFAQRIHPLSPGHRAYTASLTRVWTVYFAVVAVLS